MENSENNKYSGAWVIYTLFSGMLWILLIMAKAAGMVSMAWITVLLGIWWIPFMLLGLAMVVWFVLLVVKNMHLRIRKRKCERRVIRQAKAIGVWDKHPIVLGGRALDLKAWELLRIKRNPGEPDEHFRRRCMATAEWQKHIINLQRHQQSEGKCENE